MHHFCFTRVLPLSKKCFTTMITPVITFVFDRKHKAGPKKEGSVELRITYNRRASYISTGIRLLPRQWKNGTVCNRLDAQEIQKTLDTLMARVRGIINDMTDEGDINTAEIRSRLMRRQGARMSFIEFCEQRKDIRIYGKTGDTAERYERFLRWLREFGRIVYFSDVTDANILEMDKSLKAKGMKNYSKWNNYHRFLNSFILDAIDEGHIKRNPYRWLHIPKEKNSGLKKFLTDDELDRIERAEMPTATLEAVRDVFVFQVYTCLSYVDMCAFSEKDAVLMDDGKRLYRGRRGKTKQEFVFVLLDKAAAVLRKYDGKLPLMSNAKYNDYLKLVAHAAKVDKPITSHWARHTGATMLLNHGVEMEVIAKILGHSSTRQTREVYAKLVDETIAREMGKMEKSAPSPEDTDET